LYISADIEGTTGIAHWNEADKAKKDFEEFQKQMTAEVNAVCEGAIEAGFEDIVIKDAHDTGRNLIVRKLPQNVKMIREWSGHPYMMMQGIDDSFDAAVFTGYHSRAGSETNTLAHTLNGNSMYIKINDLYASEFLINVFTAAYAGVPVAMVTGDRGLCDEIKSFNPAISTVAVNEGIGSSTISIHPEQAVKLIKTTANEALAGDLNECLIELPKEFDIEILFKDNRLAYKKSFYPGAELEGINILLYKCKDYFDVLKFLMFTV
jgi:D-amino peptidase